MLGAGARDLSELQPTEIRPGTAHYAILDEPAGNSVNIKLMIEHCHDMLRFTGLLKLGMVRPT